MLPVVRVLHTLRVLRVRTPSTRRGNDGSDEYYIRCEYYEYVPLVLVVVMMDQSIIAEACELEDYKMMAKWGIVEGGGLFLAV